MSDIQYTITINKEDYDEMRAAYKFLQCLEVCGVDNWEGYSEAVEMHQECFCNG